MKPLPELVVGTRKKLTLVLPAGVQHYFSLVFRVNVLKSILNHKYKIQLSVLSKSKTLPGVETNSKQTQCIFSDC
jgi:hypothetical protein